MDAYFNSFFWSFRLLVLGVAAYLVAQTANAFIALGLAVPAAELAAPVRAAPTTDLDQQQPLVAAWQPFLDRNVFNAKRTDLTPPSAETEPEPQPEVEVGDLSEKNCQPSALSTNLVTTIVTRDPEESVAVFEDSTVKDVIVYRAGDVIQDEATVLRVDRRNVFVRTERGCERFSLNDQRKKAPKRNRATKPRSRRGRKKRFAELGKGVKKVGNNQFTIPKTEVDKALSNLNALAVQARIVPSFRNGKANGFKLFRIKPNSLFAKLGIRNGDIIQKVNGYDIDSPDKALAIYGKLKNARRISVDLLRKGRRKSLSYSIR